MGKQPVWEYVCNLGDASPFTEGGYFLFKDLTGVYSPEVEKFEPDGTIHRFPIDKTDLTNEWFSDDLKSVADCMGTELTELESWFKGDDIIDRAMAYIYLGEYWGFVNLDNYPINLFEDMTWESREKEFSLRYPFLNFKFHEWSPEDIEPEDIDEE